MRKKVQATNGLAGFLVSVYANTDIGKPAWMRSRTIKNFLVRFYYLTHIGLLLSAVTLLAGLAVREGEKRGKDMVILSVIYKHLLTITITTECFVPIVFWVLWVIDKKTVVLESNYTGKESISFFFNLCMHGIPSLFLLVEFFLSDFVPSSTHYIELVIFFGFYIGIMHLFYMNTGGWPYQIVALFIGWYRYIFFAYCLIMLCVIYTVLSYMHTRLNKRRLPKKQKNP